MYNQLVEEQAAQEQHAHEERPRQELPISPPSEPIKPIHAQIQQKIAMVTTPVRAMPKWSIPILWYPDSAITSLYQPVLTPVPLGDSASKAWSLLDNAYPQQDSALAYARASLPLGTDTEASLSPTSNANPRGFQIITHDPTDNFNTSGSLPFTYTIYHTNSSI